MMILVLFCIWTLARLLSAQVEFVDFKPHYAIPNRTPEGTTVFTLTAEDRGDLSARIGFKLYETELPFEFEGGRLFTTAEVNFPVGTILKLTLSASNFYNGLSTRGDATLQITGSFNRFGPTFPTNGSTVYLQRNATRSQTIWIADIEDLDQDDLNKDVAYHVESISPEGLLEFIVETGELKLLKPATEFPDKPITVVLTACNGPEAVPVRCSTGVITVEVVIPQLGQVLDLLTDLSAEKMSALANAVEVMSEYAKKDVKVAQSFVNVLGAVLDVDPAKLRAVMSTEVSTKLTGSVDSYAKDAIIPSEEGNLQVKTSNLVINLLDVKADFSDPVLQLSPACAGSGNITQPESTGANFSFSIPINVVRSGISGSDGAVRVSLSQYENSKLFQQADKEPEPVRRTVINCTSYSIPDSPVVVAVVKGANTDNMAEPITFKMSKPAHNLKYKCVYWDETERKWATNGMTVSSQSGNDIECTAHHMTAFSVLFDPTPDQGVTESHKFALSLISYIGCGLSVFGCLVTVVTYCFFRHLHADNAGKILINLCIAIGSLNVAFISGSVLTTFVLPFTIPCAVVACLIHFFSLASFMWMGIEAFNMYQLLIRVFFTVEQKHFVLRRAILGWGIPAVVAVSTSLLEVYNGEDKPYGDECRLTPRNLFVYYTAFLSPFAVIILCNSIVFVMVIFVLCKPRPDFANMTGKKADTQKSIKGAQVHGTLAVMFLLGVTWVFGAMAVSQARLLFQYVFCLTNSIQGFLIFVFRCLERQEARTAWVRFVQTGSRRPAPVLSSASNSRCATTRSAGFSTSSTGSDARVKNVEFDLKPTPQTTARKPLLCQQQKPRAGWKHSNGDRLSAFMMEDYTFDPIDQDC